MSEVLKLHQFSCSMLTLPFVILLSFRLACRRVRWVGFFVVMPIGFVPIAICTLFDLVRYY
jgi:hypothetical protein